MPNFGNFVSRSLNNPTPSHPLGKLNLQGPGGALHGFSTQAPETLPANAQGIAQKQKEVQQSNPPVDPRKPINLAAVPPGALPFSVGSTPPVKAAFGGLHSIYSRGPASYTASHPDFPGEAQGNSIIQAWNNLMYGQPQDGAGSTPPLQLDPEKAKFWRSRGRGRGFEYQPTQEELPQALQKGAGLKQAFTPDAMPQLDAGGGRQGFDTSPNNSYQPEPGTVGPSLSQNNPFTAPLDVTREPEKPLGNFVQDQQRIGQVGQAGNQLGQAIGNFAQNPGQQLRQWGGQLNQWASQLPTSQEAQTQQQVGAAGRAVGRLLGNPQQTAADLTKNLPKVQPPQGVQQAAAAGNAVGRLLGNPQQTAKEWTQNLPTLPSQLTDTIKTPQPAQTQPAQTQPAGPQPAEPPQRPPLPNDLDTFVNAPDIQKPQVPENRFHAQIERARAAGNMREVKRLERMGRQTPQQIERQFANAPGQLAAWKDQYNQFASGKDINAFNENRGAAAQEAGDRQMLAARQSAGIAPSGTKVALSQADEDDVEVIHGERKTKPIHSMMDRIVFSPEELRVPEPEDIERFRRIAQYMQAAEPYGLRKTKVLSGQVDPAILVNQVAEHSKERSFFEDIDGTHDILGQVYASVTPTALEQQAASYHPYARSVLMNERSPGALIHELGHAIDLNPRQGQSNFRRGMRWAIKPTLWEEWDAWRKGRKAFQRGVAADDLDEQGLKDYLESMRSYYERRAPAFGTYLGGAAGGLTGLGLGALAAWLLHRKMQEDGIRKGIPPRLAALLFGSGGAAGGLGGAMLGGAFGSLIPKIFARSYDQSSLNALEKYKKDPRIQEIRQRLAEIRQRQAARDGKKRKTKKASVVGTALRALPKLPALSSAAKPSIFGRLKQPLQNAFETAGQTIGGSMVGEGLDQASMGLLGWEDPRFSELGAMAGGLSGASRFLPAGLRRRIPGIKKIQPWAKETFNPDLQPFKPSPGDPRLKRWAKNVGNWGANMEIGDVAMGLTSKGTTAQRLKSLGLLAPLYTTNMQNRMLRSMGLDPANKEEYASHLSLFSDAMNNGTQQQLMESYLRHYSPETYGQITALNRMLEEQGYAPLETGLAGHPGQSPHPLNINHQIAQRPEMARRLQERVAQSPPRRQIAPSSTPGLQTLELNLRQPPPPGPQIQLLGNPSMAPYLPFSVS